MTRITSLTLIVVAIIGVIPAVPSAASSAIQSAEIIHTTAADFSVGAFDGVTVVAAGDGELVLAEDRTSGSFTSSVLKTDFEFNADGVLWTEDRPEATLLDIEMRISRDGQAWRDWRTIEQGDISGGAGRHASDLWMMMGNYVQYRLTFAENEHGQKPVLQDITFKYIDSTKGPDLASARASAARILGVTPSGQPAIIPRAAWNPVEPYSSVNWPPEYDETRTAIIHHTDTPIDTDPAVAVLAIWYYHTYTLEGGMGDIGYNYLVDKFGNIYEGRYGGDNAVGGHSGGIYNYGSLGVALIGNYVDSPPAPPALSSLVDLLAWKLSWHYSDPTGSDWFWDRYVPNVMGHLDLGSTACPGHSLYALLPGVRGLTKFREGWGGHGTPSRMSPGQTIGVSVEVQNRGTQTWYAGGSYPFDIGYHWYLPNGTQYVQSVQDDHRTSVPWPVAYGQNVTINTLLTAPTVPGTYTLQWDMVQEMVSWFASYGNVPLVTTVIVAPEATATPTATFTPTRTPTMTPTPTFTPVPTFTPTPIPPTLRAQPDVVSFLAAPGSPARPQVISIENAGTGSFSWVSSPSSQGGWLYAEPLSSGLPGMLSVSVNQIALAAVSAPAVLEGSILIQASSGTVGSPQTIPVRLVVANRLYSAYFPVVSKGYLNGW